MSWFLWVLYTTFVAFNFSQKYSSGDFGDFQKLLFFVAFIVDVCWLLMNIGAGELIFDILEGLVGVFD